MSEIPTNGEETKAEDKRDRAGYGRVMQAVKAATAHGYYTSEQLARGRAEVQAALDDLGDDTLGLQAVLEAVNISYEPKAHNEEVLTEEQ